MTTAESLTDEQIRDLRDSILVDEQSLDLWNACVRSLGVEPTTGMGIPRHLPYFWQARQVVADAINAREATS